MFEKRRESGRSRLTGFCINYYNHSVCKNVRYIWNFFFHQGLISDEDEEHFLSPAEQRALNAEKRAAWRQARLKSLEQVKLETRYMCVCVCVVCISIY